METKSPTEELAGQLVERAAQHGGDKLLEEAAVLLLWFLEERAALLNALGGGDQYVIRKDKEDSLGVIYTDPALIGAVVVMRDTGRRVPS